MTKKLLLLCLLMAFCFAFGTQETKAQCQANFTMTVDSGLVFFTDQSGSFIDPVVAWQWDFGMGAGSTEQNPVLTLPEGVYNPCLTITTASGCTAVTCDTLFVSDGGGDPMIDSCMIFANFDLIQMGGAIDFQNTSSGNFTSWVWDFGDGNTSTAFSPSHQYNVLGFFTVCLTIANEECTETYCMEVDASGSGGGCNVFITSNIDTLGTVPVTGIFEAIAAGGTAPYTYTWNIGGLMIGDFTSTVSYTFDSPGVYEVCVDMTDAAGCVSTNCTVIIVEEDPIGWDCQSNFTYGEVPGAIGVLFTSMSTGSGISSFFWDFDDGATSTISDPIHDFVVDGTYTVCLTITTADGCVSTSCQNVTIGDAPCTSDFSLTTTDLSISCFNMSTPLMGSAFLWHFGNGDISTEMNPTYTYDAAGTYDVCLSVLTNTAIDSCFAQTCQSITVIDGGILANAMIGEISLGDETMPIQFDATVFLISVDNNPITGELSYTIVDSVVVVGLNTTTYSFDGMPSGNYLVMADVGASSLGTDVYFPTYHLDASSWLDATVINFSSPDTLVDININMISVDDADGLGTISGTIDEDAGKDNVAGVLVILYSESGTPVAFTHTDANGNYSFDNLALGTYQVQVEIMGLESDWATVVLDEENTTASIVDFDISTEGIHTTYATVGIEEDVFGFSFTLLQNPVTEKIRFDLNMETNQTVRVQLTDLQGKVILQQSNINVLAGQTQQWSLDVAHLPSGVYLLQVNNTAGAKKVLKVVK